VSHDAIALLTALLILLSKAEELLYRRKNGRAAIKKVVEEVINKRFGVK
jgi:hypothetical protein